MRLESQSVSQSVTGPPRTTSARVELKGRLRSAQKWNLMAASHASNSLILLLNKGRRFTLTEFYIGCAQEALPGGN